MVLIVNKYYSSWINEHNFWLSLYSSQWLQLKNWVDGLKLRKNVLLDARPQFTLCFKSCPDFFEKFTYAAKYTTYVIG